MAVEQARFGRNLTLLSGPLWQTRTFALVVVHNVARSPIFAIPRTNVVLAVLAIKQRRTLAPLLAIFDYTFSEVARQFTFHRSFLRTLNDWGRLVGDLVIVWT